MLIIYFVVVPTGIKFYAYLTRIRLESYHVLLKLKYSQSVY